MKETSTALYRFRGLVISLLPLLNFINVHGKIFNVILYSLESIILQVLPVGSVFLICKSCKGKSFRHFNSPMKSNARMSFEIHIYGGGMYHISISLLH